ncbi:MAG: TetR/AcrR family transcriptional regulator [Legionellales bacterium]|nr:TetR/AcrR family transcriptional regulator [Legionellales bacterium]
MTGKLTKETLVRTTLNQLLEHGYERTLLDTIAHLCGVGKSSIYHYVTTKEELALLALDAKIAAVKHKIQKISVCPHLDERIKEFNVFCKLISHEVTGFIFLKIETKNSELLQEKIDTYFHLFWELIHNMIEQYVVFPAKADLIIRSLLPMLAVPLFNRIFGSVLHRELEIFQFIVNAWAAKQIPLGEYGRPLQ